MKLLVLSDSHGDVDAIITAVTQFDPELLIFLGDGSGDLLSAAKRLPTLRYYAVSGNCDLAAPFPQERQLQLEGVNVLAAHGHRYRVKSDLLAFMLRARECQARLALFGHTHLPLCEESDGTLFLNPGSCRLSYGSTGGLVEISDGKVAGRIVKIERKF